MKVLFITPAYYPNLKVGSERSLQMITEGLAKKKIDVVVLSFDNNKKEVTREEYNRVKVIRVKKVKIGPNTLAHNISLLKYKYIVKEERPDIIHVYNTWHIPAASKLISIAPVMATLNNYYPIIATAYTKDNIIEKSNHTNLEVFFSIKNTLDGNIIKRYALATFYTIYSIFIRKKSRKIDKYIVYADSIGKLYQRWCFDKEKFTTISSPFELDKEAKKSRRDKNTVLYVGGPYEAKGFYELLEAAKILKDEKIKFFFVGIKEVPMRAHNIVKKNNLHVEFIGKLDHDKLFQYYAKCTVLVHPSLWPEPFSRVWIEALQNNIPIISADNPTALEILKGGAAFYKRGNQKELAKRIKEFIDGKIKIDASKTKKRVLS